MMTMMMIKPVATFFVTALLLLVILPLSSFIAVPADAACSLADADNTSGLGRGGLPACVRVGFLSLTPNGASNPLTPTQQYWSNTLPRRVWSSVKKSISVRGITVEETQTSLDWDQGLAAVKAGTYDIFITNFWILASRTTDTDFAIPYMKESWGLLAVTPPITTLSPVVNWADPFEGEVWILMIFVFLFGGIMLWCAELINHGFGGESHQVIIRPDEDLTEDPFMMLRNADFGSYFEGLSNAISHAYGCIFGTFDVVPRSFGGWIVSWTIQWFVFVFLASYTANLASFLTLRKSAPPVSPKELFSQPMIAIPTAEIKDMIATQTASKTVLTFSGGVVDYLSGFRASNAKSAALPELDLREITLKNCDLSWTPIDFSVESGFAFRLSDSMYAVKQVVDEAILQFADFGILDNWVSSGLPPDQCERDSALGDGGAMGVPELGGAFVVAACLFFLAMVVGVLTWLRERRMHANVIRKFGDNGPHRSDDIDLVDEAIDACKSTVVDAKRSAAGIIKLLATRTTDLGPEAARADWRHSAPVPSRKLAGGGGPIALADQSLKNIYMFLNDGIDDVDGDGDTKSEASNDLSSEADESEDEDVDVVFVDSDDDGESSGAGVGGGKKETKQQQQQQQQNAGGGAGRANRMTRSPSPQPTTTTTHQTNDLSGASSRVRPPKLSAAAMQGGEGGDGHSISSKRGGSPSDTSAISAKHLAKISGSVVAVSSALHLAEDALNRAGRRRYCTLPIDTCNSRDGRCDIAEANAHETPEEYSERMQRERIHVGQMLEVARNATKTCKAVTDAAETALLSSLMQQHKRRRVLEKWVRRSFRTAAFLTLLIASTARRIANEAVYVSRMYLENRRGALAELGELAALIATEVEGIIRSVQEEEMIPTGGGEDGNANFWSSASFALDGSGSKKNKQQHDGHQHQHQHQHYSDSDHEMQPREAERNIPPLHHHQYPLETRQQQQHHQENASSVIRSSPTGSSIHPGGGAGDTWQLSSVVLTPQHGEATGAGGVAGHQQQNPLSGSSSNAARVQQEQQRRAKPHYGDLAPVGRSFDM